MEHSRTCLSENLAGGPAHWGEQLKPSSPRPRSARWENPPSPDPGHTEPLTPGSQLLLQPRLLYLKGTFHPVSLQGQNLDPIDGRDATICSAIGVTHNQWQQQLVVGGPVGGGACEPPSPHGLRHPRAWTRVWGLSPPLPREASREGPGPQGGQRPAPTGSAPSAHLPQAQEPMAWVAEGAPGATRSRRGWAHPP